MSPVYYRTGIKGYRVLRSEHKDNQLNLHLELERRTKVNCPYCEGVRLRSKGKYRRNVRHLDSMGIPCHLVIHTRRFTCQECTRSFLPTLPGILPSRRSSEPFRAHLFRQHHEGICASSLARAQRVSAHTVSRIYEERSAPLLAQRAIDQCPRILGIDEHTLHKKQRFATTFCDLQNRKIFDVVNGRCEADMVGFLQKLRGRERVRVVCIDLSSPYRALIRRWFPRAKIVADRFHVIRVVIHHFLNLVRSIAPSLKNSVSRLTLFRKNPQNLTQDQRLFRERLFDRNPALKPIYHEMQNLRSLLNLKGRKRKECLKMSHKLLGFIERLKSSAFAPLLTLANTLNAWAQEIACMWRFSKNNGITEGFHRKMKLIQRRAYGFRNFYNYRLRVIAQCG